MPIRSTRRLVAAALDGSLQRADLRTDPYFGLAVPAQVPGVEPHILEPIKTWRSKAEFAEVAGRVVQMFPDSFKDCDPGVSRPSTPRRLNDESEMAAQEKRRTRPKQTLPF
jgi:ATP-dependent phosphoenolpyruvate carboxykinase